MTPEIWLGIGFFFAVIIPLLIGMNLFSRPKDIDATKLWAMEQFIHKDGLDDFRKDIDRRLDSMERLIEKIFDRIDSGVKKSKKK